MATFRITPDKLGRALMNEGEKTRKAYHRGVTRAAHRGKARLITATKEKGVDYLGQFRNSFHVAKRGDDVVLYNDAPHAGIVELGARPHPVSREGIAALAQWAMTKLGTDPSEARGVAFAIARKIRRFGQKGRFIFRDEMPKLSRFVAEEVERAIRQTKKGPGA